MPKTMSKLYHLSNEIWENDQDMIDRHEYCQIWCKFLKTKRCKAAIYTRSVALEINQLTMWEFLKISSINCWPQPIIAHTPIVISTSRIRFEWVHACMHAAMRAQHTQTVHTHTHTHAYRERLAPRQHEQLHAVCLSTPPRALAFINNILGCVACARSRMHTHENINTHTHTAVAYSLVHTTRMRKIAWRMCARALFSPDSLGNHLSARRTC